MADNTNSPSSSQIAESNTVTVVEEGNASNQQVNYYCFPFGN